MTEVELGHFLAQPGVGPLALGLHVLDAPLVAGERLAERVQKLCDGRLAPVEVALGRSSCLVEPGVGQGQELLVVLRQGLRRQLRERSGQPAALLLRPRGRLRAGPAYELELRHCHRPRRLGLRCAAGGRLQLPLLPDDRGLRIGQPTLCETDCGGQPGSTRLLCHDADHQPDDQSHDRFEDHAGQCNDGVSQGRGPCWPSRRTRV